MEDREQRIKEQLERAKKIFNGGFIPTSIWSDVEYLLSIIDSLRGEVEELRAEKLSSKPPYLEEYEKMKAHLDKLRKVVEPINRHTKLLINDVLKFTDETSLSGYKFGDLRRLKEAIEEEK